MRSRTMPILLVGLVLLGAAPSSAQSTLTPAAAPKPIAAKAGRKVDVVAVARASFPKVTRVGESEATFGNGLSASVASAVKSGRAAFTSSANGWVTLTIDAAPGRAYGITCDASATPIVAFSKDRPQRPPTKAYIQHKCQASSWEPAAVQRECYEMKETANLPAGCGFSHTDGPYSHNGRSFTSYVFQCEQTQLGLVPQRTETAPTWTASLLEGATWRALKSGTDDQPNTIVAPAAPGRVQVKIAYDIAGKRSDVVPCAQQKVVMLNPDHRAAARYPRIVDTCAEGILEKAQDTSWDLGKCTVTEFAIGK